VRGGFSTPFEVVRACLTLGTSKHVETAGPVQIVRSTGQAGQRGPFRVLSFLGFLGAYLWPSIPLMHLLDAASLPAFFPPQGAGGESEASLRSLRFQRLRLTFDVVLTALGVGMIAVTVTDLGQGPYGWVGLAVAWTAPIVVLLAWWLTRSMWGRAKAAVAVAGLMIPSFNLAVLVFIAIRAHAYKADEALEATPIS
jgi:hypothetical protein